MQQQDPPLHSNVAVPQVEAAAAETVISPLTVVEWTMIFFSVNTDFKLSKLTRLLDGFGGKLPGPMRSKADAIVTSIRFLEAKTGKACWDELLADKQTASRVNVLLHHLTATVDPLRNLTNAIFIESLQDELFGKYEEFDNDVLGNMPPCSFLEGENRGTAL